MRPTSSSSLRGSACFGPRHASNYYDREREHEHDEHEYEREQHAPTQPESTDYKLRQVNISLKFSGISALQTSQPMLIFMSFTGSSSIHH